ncbi:MAG: hypothetical protein VYE77_08600 [Planctomycetota bacterium]|nr:hypothetical protein [Planctomycetota bacterium]
MNAHPPRHQSFAATLAASLTLTLLLPAQTLPEGYATDTTALPTGANSILVIPEGTAWFDGTDLVFTRHGQAPQTLLQFASSRFGAFTRLVRDGNALLFGESSFGELWLAPLDGSPPQLVTTLNLPYDAVSLGPQRVMVSAKTGGFSASHNDLIAVDLQTGTTTNIASIPGASGSVLLTDQGDLLYATAPATFPPPPGSVEILQFSAAQWSRPLTGGSILSSTEAQPLFQGIDAAGFMALDADGDILFVDWLNNKIAEINDLHSGGWLTTLVDYSGSGLSPAGVTLLQTNSRQFEPFAQPSGATLFVHETDFFSTDQLRSLTTKPAELIAPSGTVPSGPFVLGIQGASAGGLAAIAVNTTNAGVPALVELPGIEQTFWWDAAMFHPLNSYWSTLDGQGQANVTLNNPGVTPALTLYVQAAFLSANTDVMGATTPGSVHLGL